MVPLSATLFSFIYGVCRFSQKGKPPFLPSITTAMGSHALVSSYYLCQTRTTDMLVKVCKALPYNVDEIMDIKDTEGEKHISVFEGKI